MTLTDFLLARIAEDEADARQLAVDLDRWDRERAANGADGTQGSIVVSTLHGGAFDPARVLAECEAKRRIVTTYLEMTTDEETAEFMVGESSIFRTALLDLAAIYAGHADYREEWRP